MQFTFADIFAGIGGFRKAFEELGGNCVLSIESDAYCKETQEANFVDSARHHWHSDIRDFEREIDCDLLCAGFPCQPFSRAGIGVKNTLGLPHGFEDKTNGTLFFDLAKIIQRAAPKVFLLENVPALKSHDEGNTFKIILETFEEMGYATHWAILCSSPWVPQKRKRIFIAGFREDILFSPFNHIQYPDTNPPILADILETSVGAEFRFSRERYESALAHREGQAAKGNGFGTVVLTPDEQARTLTKHYANGGDEMLIDDTLIDYGRYELSENRLERLQDRAQRNPRSGFRAQVFGLDDRLCTLLATSGPKDGGKILIDEFCSDKSKHQIAGRDGKRRPRILTPRECARLMGFDEPGKPEWKIVVSNSQAYRQFGNAVVVPLVRAIGRTILPHLVG